MENTKKQLDPELAKIIEKYTNSNRDIIEEFEKVLEVPSGLFINKRFSKGYETAKKDAKDFLKNLLTK